MTITAIIITLSSEFLKQLDSNSFLLIVEMVLFIQSALTHASHPRSKVAPSPELGGTVNPDLAREVKDIPTTASPHPAGDRTTYPEHHLH